MSEDSRLLIVGSVVHDRDVRMARVPGLLEHRIRVWLGELELAGGAIGSLTDHEMLPRGVNVTETALQWVGIEERTPPADWKATVVTCCATSVT